MKVKLYTFELQRVFIDTNVFFNKSFLRNSNNCSANSNLCFSPADLWLLTLQASTISEAWKNNGLGRIFASYRHFCDNDSFFCFSSNSRICYSANLRRRIHHYFNPCSTWHNSRFVWYLVCNCLALSRLERLL